MSEQAVRTTAETMAMAAKSLLRVMVELLIKRKGRRRGEPNRPNVPLVENAEMSFSYQKMYVSYQKL